MGFRRVLAVGAVIACLVLPGSGAGGGDAAGGTWVGPVQGSNAFVAIVRDAQQIAAYVCDNGSVGSWFFGPDGTADNVQLASRDGSRIAINLDDKKATGTYTKDGRAYKFEARATDKQVLWRAEATEGDTAILAGWIQNGNESRGTLGIGSVLVPAPSLSPNINFNPITPGITITLSPAPMGPDSVSQAYSNEGDAGKFFWGAAGDSFASGEGNPEHGINNSNDPNTFTGLSWGNDSSMYVGTSTDFQADITTCHRSDRAGAPKAQATLKSLYQGMTFVLGFVACSGAKTTHMLNDGYTGPAAVPASRLGLSIIPQDAQLTQLDDFRTLEGGRLDAIYMSIGGNDAGFGDIVSDCISPFGPSDCGATWSQTLSNRLSNMSTSYTNVANRITSLFGSSIPVFISDYPNPLDNGSNAPCQGDDYNAHADVGFGHWDDALKNNVTPSEATFAYGIADRLNAAVSAAASAHSSNWTEISTHTPAFIGHGVCTASPFANLNSSALRRQGRDVPNTSFFLFSSGFMHPNDSGYAQYGSAIVDVLRPVVDARARLGLNAGANLRVGAATLNGNVTIHWNDRSYTENAYDVEVLPARPQDAALIDAPSGAATVSSTNGNGFRIRISGTDGEDYTHAVSGGGQFLYRVRACQTGISSGATCGPYTARITGTNMFPAMPTGVVATVQTGLVNGSVKQTDSVSWAAQTDAIQYVVRVETTGSTVETRTPTTSFSQTHVTGATYKVAACNRVGCSGYVTATAG